MAASASPSACTIFCCFSCTARSTKKAARWASCWATCLDSTAAVYSLPKDSSVRDTSSRMMLKSRARSTSSLRISKETCNKKRNIKYHTRSVIMLATNLLTLSDQLRSIELGDNALQNLVTDGGKHLLIVVQTQLAVHGWQVN